MENVSGSSKWFSLILFLTLTITGAVNASETDQFYASSAVIKDSSDAINNYFHKSIKAGIKKANDKDHFISCREVASNVLTQVLGKFSVKRFVHDKSYSKVSHFIETSPLIDRFPNDNISSKEYRLGSIYQRRPFLDNIIGISKTININGIYIGGDKIGHFSIIGKTYYKNFLDGLSDGLSAEDAQIKAIKKGFKQETYILGYHIGGTFSFADLEANFQGLTFARNMCEGENPYLIQRDGKWAPNYANIFDIRKYINPKMDESYNISLFTSSLWKKIKGDVVNAYCKNISDPHYLQRSNAYQYLLTNTINDQLINKFLEDHPSFDRSNQSLNFCSCEKNCK